MIYYLLGDFEKAVPDLAKASGLAPGNKEASAIFETAKAKLTATEAAAKSPPPVESKPVEVAVVLPTVQPIEEQAPIVAAVTPAPIAPVVHAPASPVVPEPMVQTPSVPKPTEQPKRVPKIVQPPASMSVDNRSAEELVRQGREYTDKSRFLEAIDEFTKAIQKNPKHFQAYNSRGYAKMRVRNYKGAVEDFDRAIALSPGYPNAIKNREAALRVLAP